MNHQKSYEEKIKSIDFELTDTDSKIADTDDPEIKLQLVEYHAVLIENKNELITAEDERKTKEFIRQAKKSQRSSSQSVFNKARKFASDTACSILDIPIEELRNDTPFQRIDDCLCFSWTHDLSKRSNNVIRLPHGYETPYSMDSSGQSREYIISISKMYSDKKFIKRISQIYRKKGVAITITQRANDRNSRRRKSFIFDIYLKVTDESKLFGCVTGESESFNPEYYIESSNNDHDNDLDLDNYSTEYQPICNFPTSYDIDHEDELIKDQEAVDEATATEEADEATATEAADEATATEAVDEATAAEAVDETTATEAVDEATEGTKEQE